MVKRSEKADGFPVIRKSWTVGRKFLPLDKCRRRSTDYELIHKTSEAWVRIAMINRMLHRLAPEGEGWF